MMVPAADRRRFDCGHIGVSDVRRTPGGWRLWYFGGGEAVIETGLPALGAVTGLAMRCGTASSRDGMLWEREPGDTASGALFDVLNDEMYAAWPNIVPLKSRTLLQYTAPTRDMADYRTRIVAIDLSGAVERVGPLSWSGPCAPHDAGGIVTRHVIAHPCRPGGWLMAYTALDRQHRRSIALAESEDGVTWRRHPEPVLRAGVPGAWDDFGVAVNCCVAVEGRLFLYYYGFSSRVAPVATRGIGLAIADVGDAWQFERVAGDRADVRS